MQAEFTNRCRDLVGKLPDIGFIGGMRKHEEVLAVAARDDVAGPAQAAPHGLPHSSQSRVRCVASEDTKVGIEFIERENDNGQGTSLAPGYSPVVLQYLPEGAAIEEPGNRIIA